LLPGRRVAQTVALRLDLPLYAEKCSA